VISENPLNYLLFKYGYLGRVNLFEYWTENRTDFLKFVSNYAPEVLHTDVYLEDFEAKVRWRSPIGALLVEEIRNIFRKTTAGNPIDLKQVTILYGKKKFTLQDFNRLHPCSSNNNNHINIRGISLIKSNLSGVIITGIDMTYAIFNRSQFVNTYFEDCNLSYASFDGSHIDGCNFNASCVLKFVNFRNAYVCAQFHADIEGPILSPLKKKHVFDMMIDMESLWKPYTEIWGNSFAEHCKSDDLTEYISRLQNTLTNARNAKSNGILTKSRAFILSNPAFPKGG